MPKRSEARSPRAMRTSIRKRISRPAGAATCTRSAACTKNSPAYRAKSRPHGITLGLPRIAVVHLQQPLAPGERRIVGLEQPRRRNGARPLEGAEQDVIGETRPVAAEKEVLREHRPHGIERAAKRGERVLRIFAELLERHAVALL